MMDRTIDQFFLGYVWIAGHGKLAEAAGYIEWDGTSPFGNRRVWTSFTPGPAYWTFQVTDSMGKGRGHEFIQEKNGYRGTNLYQPWRLSKTPVLFYRVSEHIVLGSLPSSLVRIV